MSCPSSASRSLASSAQRSRQPTSTSVRFQSRTFLPNPSGPTSRIVSMTCACGWSSPLAVRPQCTLRSATIPCATNCSRTKSCASPIACAWVSSRGRAISISRASCASLRFSAGLDLVPQRRAVGQTRRRAVGQQDFRVDHPRLVGEVVRPAEPLVVQFRGRAVGRRGHRAASVRAADHLRREMVDRHGSGRLRSVGVARLSARDVAQQRISAHSRNSADFARSPAVSDAVRRFRSILCPITLRPEPPHAQARRSRRPDQGTPR